MTSVRAVVRDERGVAVVVAVIALMTLTAMVLAFLAVSTYEPQIARNLADSTRARYIAEAGLESAYDTLINDTNWNGLLAGATCGQGSVIGVVNNVLPGLTATSGTYTVRMRNDCTAGDDLLTGVTVENVANAATDTNDHVILTSIGTFGTATKTILVSVSRVANIVGSDPPPTGKLQSALAFPGYESDTSFTGNSFEVDGRNHDLNGNLVTPQSALYGISVGPEDQFVAKGGPVMHHEDSIQTSLASNQKDNLTGLDQTNASNVNATGDNTIAASTMTSQAVTDFVNAIKSYADTTINSTPSSPASFTNIGSTCPGGTIPTPPPSGCWGTATDPKITYIKGQIDTTSAFNALTVAGNSTGYGILVVEDGDAIFKGNFAWNGIIIITGGYVGVGILGGGNQDVLGALISNETATNEAPGFYEGVLQGNAKVRYSRAGLDLALAALQKKIPGTGGTNYVSVRMYNFREQ